MNENVRNNVSKSNRLLFIVLPVLVVLITWLISTKGVSTGFALLAGIMAVAIGILSLIYPAIGFYFSMTFTFFSSDIDRFFVLDVPLVSSIDILMFITFLGVIFNKLARTENYDSYKHPILYACLAMLFYRLICIFNPAGGSIILSFLIIKRFFTFIFFLFIAVYLFKDVKSILFFFKFWLALALITALYGCIQEWFGYPRYEMNYIFSDPKLVGLYSLKNGNYRKFSFLADPTSFGLLMSGSCLIAIIILLNVREQGKRIISFIMIILMMLATGYSGTRTAYFSLMIGVALYILMTMANFKTLIFACIAVLFLFVIVFGPIYGNPTINRIRSTFMFSEDASLNVRNINRQRMQPYLLSHPIGGGIGTTGVNGTKINPGHPLAGFPTDSGFLRVGLELGWIGLIIDCFVFFFILQRAVSIYYRSINKHHKTLIMASIICLFSYIVANYAQSAIGALPGAFLFYALVAVIVRIDQIENKIA